MSENLAAPDLTAASQAASSPPAACAPTQPPGSLLEVADLAKAFGATQALRSCSFDLRPGEVHAIVGENGSGKSTLVKILAGVHRPDAGEVVLDGQPLRGWATPRSAQRSGIITVFQEVLVVGPQPVLENVWLGSDGLFTHRLGAGEKRRRAEAVLSELLVDPPPLDVPAEALSLSDRQTCCIARALVREPRVLILDESTSAVDIATRDRLFAVIRRLRARGVGVIFISHRMDEVNELADRVTVLRSGRSVATLTRGQATTEVLVRHMTGEEQLTAGVQKRASRARIRGEVLLRTEGLKLHSDGAAVDVTIHSGELVGLAGLEGHGQDRFLQALRGAEVSAGRVLAGEGARTEIGSPAEALRAGVVYVPRDRRSESLFPTLSVVENFSVPTLGTDRRARLVCWGATRQRLAGYVQRLGIRLAHPSQPIVALSGGNQQKLVLARWLAAHPRVLLLNDPTRGIDLGAKRDLYGVLEQLAAEGVAVVMLSTEVDEHVELMDRVLVFREGSVSRELSCEDLSRSALVAALFGGEA